jgi:hypothetical protein
MAVLFLRATQRVPVPSYEGLLIIAWKSTLLVVSKCSGFRDAKFNKIRHGHFSRGYRTDLLTAGFAINLPSGGRRL